MNYLFQIINSSTNYKAVNMPNIHNLLFDIIDLTPKDKRKEFHKLIKKNMGIQFFDNFSFYCSRKKLDISYKD